MDALNFVWIGAALTVVLALLPESPFQMLSNSAISEYVGYLNWIIPISSMVAILEAWLVAVAIFYIHKVILRWIKAIG